MGQMGVTNVRRLQRSKVCFGMIVFLGMFAFVCFFGSPLVKPPEAFGLKGKISTGIDDYSDLFNDTRKIFYGIFTHAKALMDRSLARRNSH